MQFLRLLRAQKVHRAAAWSLLQLVRLISDLWSSLGSLLSFKLNVRFLSIFSKKFRITRTFSKDCYVHCTYDCFNCQEM